MLAKMNPQRSTQHNLWIVALTAVIATAMLPVAARFSTPAAPVLGSAKVDFGKLLLSFEPNAGQTDDSVRFLTHASGGTLFFTPSEVVLALQGRREHEDIASTSTSATMMGATATDESALTDTPGSVVRMQFVGASGELAMQGVKQLPGRVNYFIGNDPSKWHSDLPTYGNIAYSGLYSGIDLAYSGTGGQLKGTYTVAAGSDPSQIRWRYSGGEKVTVDQAGNLQITVATLANTNKDAEAVTVTEQAPVAWQEIAGTRIPVSARYLIAADQSIGFVLGSYDPNHPLIIDPTLTYSTYLGGNGGESGNGIAVDTSGNAYVTGNTVSTNFPLQNPFQPTFGGGYDAFVTKFSATGSTLIYSTYLGGSGWDEGWGIAVDTSGNAYVTGYTASTNFPLQNPFQPTFGGINDAFVAKINDQPVSTPTVTPVPPTNTPVPPTNTPVPPSGTPVPPTATSAPPTATQASTSTSTTVPPTSTAVPPTSTSVPPTLTQPPATATATATASPEPCTVSFTDVPEGSTFYTFIRCLACRGIISGYADGTFKPNNQVTRGQLAKIVSNAAGFTEDPNPQMFEDVPPANTFYQWINRLARRGHMSGYPCGGVGEPCTTGMPYFRPFANATRGQTSKIVSNAAGYTEIPTDQTFEDVPATHTFYREIQRLASRNIMQGYPCGGVGEPCLTGRPYFRPANNVTRGQSAKIVANTFYPNCTTP